MWDFVNSREVVARKVYRCAECNGPIVVGMRHQYTSGKVEGFMTDYRLCPKCVRLSSVWLFEFDGGQGWPLGELRADLRARGVEDVDAWIAKVEAARARVRATMALADVRAAIVAEIQLERRRQIESEGCPPEHDDKYVRGELARAGATYALTGVGVVPPVGLWPWGQPSFKPKNRRRDLVRAAALIVAEIERLDRQAAHG
jgi:hypothetical protein